MNMQVGKAVPTRAPAQEQAREAAQATAQATAPATAQERELADARVSRRLYLPTLVIAGLAGWLSWRGWTALGQGTGIQGTGIQGTGIASTGIGNAGAGTAAIASWVVFLLLTAGLLWRQRD